MFRFATSYGAISSVIEYLTKVEKCKLQQLSKWHYGVNLPRLQRRFKFFAGSLSDRLHFGTGQGIPLMYGVKNKDVASLGQHGLGGYVNLLTTGSGEIYFWSNSENRKEGYNVDFYQFTPHDPQ